MPVMRCLIALLVALTAWGCGVSTSDLSDCATYVGDGFRKIADERSKRFLGKVQEDTARCRGGDQALVLHKSPWTDWQNYLATRDAESKAPGLSGEHIHLGPNGRGIDGALLDLEYQRIELIKFNLFDNNGTYEQYVRGSGTTDGPAVKVWEQMRLPKNNPFYTAVGGDGPQLCRGDLIRARTLTGICNDIKNPLMGSAGQLFARNVELDTTFPELGYNDLLKNRHGYRLGMLKPDPPGISRRLFTRSQSDPAKCNDGQGLPGYSPQANCDYKKAPFFNVLAAFWIQFMTHDWFSHLDEGHNSNEMISTGCASQKVNGVETSLTPADIARLDCRPSDAMERAYVADADRPGTFMSGNKSYYARAPKTFRNTNT